MEQKISIHHALSDKEIEKLNQVGISTPELASLLHIHQTLWGLEDRARSKKANDKTISAIKREIDICNGNRHQQIDLMDSMVTTFECSAESATIHNETVGELVDRILIMALKTESCRKLANDETLEKTKRDQCAAKFQHLVTWNKHLVVCLDNLLADINSKIAMLPPRVGSKFYNDPTLNPVTRAELENS